MGVGALEIPGRPSLPWRYFNPLSSTAGLSVNAGSWGITDGVLAISPPANTNCRAVTDYAIDTTAESHVVAVDVRIPSGWTADSHFEIGFNINENTSGKMHASARFQSGTMVSILEDEVAW